MTQTLTHTESGLCGVNETHRVKLHTHSEQTGLKSIQRGQKHQRSAAHNPEVVGSNPAPATRKPLESQDSGGFILFLCTFLVAGFLPFHFDPDFDPYGSLGRLERESAEKDVAQSSRKRIVDSQISPLKLAKKLTQWHFYVTIQKTKRRRWTK